MTASQVLLGVGLIVALAVGSQVLASRLRIPALIILLPAGFTAGAITTDVNPQHLLGATFQPLVSLAVAVILYDAGISLDLRKLARPRYQVRPAGTRGRGHHGPAQAGPALGCLFHPPGRMLPQTARGGIS